ncbi:uncharacterized protein LOC142477223 [Ascaphus truei]|uniref:uncharacterized protein LOC142477223 n=1 Tax=Ascaphus truei TaxID=8439 RepID=UPI003F594F64
MVGRGLDQHPTLNRSTQSSQQINYVVDNNSEHTPECSLMPVSTGDLSTPVMSPNLIAVEHPQRGIMPLISVQSESSVNEINVERSVLPVENSVEIHTPLIIQPPNDAADQSVFLERVAQYQRVRQNFNAVEHFEHFQFVNLDRITSFSVALQAVHDSIQCTLNRLLPDIGPHDMVQLRLDGDTLNRALYSIKRSKDALSAETFLEHVANMLQSNAEVLGDGTLRLLVIIVKNRVGGVMHRRRINSTPYSRIVNKKRQLLFDLNNDSHNLCLAASLCALLEKRDTADAVLLEKARLIHRTLGIPDDRLVSFSDIPDFEKHLNVTIKVFYHNRGEWQFFNTSEPCKERVLFIYHEDTHYFGVKKINAFIGANYFCDFCHTPFAHKNNHSCRYFCRSCHRRNCVEVIADMPRCPMCRAFCRSQDCLSEHKKLAQAAKIDCKRKKYCDRCGRYTDDDHDECRGLQCRVCYAYIASFDNHLCYMRPYKPPVLTDNYIFYDFECMQETGVHIPNYVYAMPLRDDEEKGCAQSLDGTVGWEFQGPECLADFVKKFIDRPFREYTFIAHNAGRYDSYFVVQQLLKEKIKIELLAQGGKLLCVTIPDLNIRFIDSLNFLPMKLSKLPQALGFTGSKGYFPHFFNTVQNQNYSGSMPSIEHYGPQYMMADEKTGFMTWYEANKHCDFNFQAELKSYCIEDVKILKKACICFRTSVIEMTEHTVMSDRESQIGEEDVYNVDPFQLTTLASVCMAMYRLKFLPSNTIAIVPPDNYNITKKRFSTPATQWLLYVAYKENIVIQHALRGGEKMVGNYFLDGYAVINGVQTAFEFNGCFYHGCPMCYNEKDTNTVTSLTYGQLYHKTAIKTHFLKTKCGYAVRELWEHEWKHMLETDTDLKAFLLKSDFPQPMNPRDALYGGRTNAIKLYHKTAPGESIHYYDFTSLYPFINKTKMYPTGHPKIIYENFLSFDRYFGIAKVKVYPPRGLFFPILPVKMNGKLMFPLCSTCAVTNQTTPCCHTDEERSLTGTWCTVEIQAALKKGYRLCKIFEIWHFACYTKKLFAKYIKVHLRDKQEASGYPSWCTDEVKKQKYISEYFSKEGIRLRADKIDINPAKRQISKLFLNSLWGKFGQKTNLQNTSIVTSPDELFGYAFSTQYDVSSLDFLDDDTAMVSWKYTKEGYTVGRNVNIFIACFTTAYARLELYNVLDKLQERCLYHDTDSVIFVSKTGDWNPPLGDYLGELTSELPNGTHITEFVSAGPKTYGYKLSTGKTCLKVKGITLNAANAELINFDTLKDIVLDYPLHSDPEDQKKIVVQQAGIVRNKRYWQIETRPLQKTQKCVYTKRQLTNDFTTLPFGY